MEVQPITWEAIMESLRERAARSQVPLIVEARIAVSPQEARLLDLQLVRPLDTIPY
jgi:hypothetical protein